jgi:hypothetical protein
VLDENNEKISLKFSTTWWAKEKTDKAKKVTLEL